MAGTAADQPRVTIDESGIRFYDHNDDRDDPVLMGEFTGNTLSVGSLSVGELDAQNIVDKEINPKVLFVHKSAGSDANDGDGPGTVTDACSGTASNSWAAASDGTHTWTKANGTAGHFSSAGGYNLIANTGTTPDVMLTNWGARNMEALLKVRGDQVAPGAVAHYAAVLKASGASTYIRAGFTVPNGGGLITADVRKLVAGSETSLATNATAYTFAANTDYYVRAQAYILPTDTTTVLVKVRVWKTTDSEPGTWDVSTSTTGNSLVHGVGAGVTARMGGAGAPSMTFSTDSISIYGIEYDPATAGFLSTDMGGSPKQTIQAAVDSLANYLGAEIYIALAINETYYTPRLSIEGFNGEGSLDISAGLGTLALFYGSLKVSGCNCDISIWGGDWQDDASGDWADANNSTFYIKQSSLITLDSMSIDGNSNVATLIRASGSRVVASNSNYTGSTTRGIGADNCSVVFASNNVGDANALYRANASIIFINGTQPNATNTTANSGQIFTTGTAADGTKTAGSGTGSATKTTKTYKSLQTQSYHLKVGWVTESDLLYQSTFHKGLWTYDYATIASDLSGKTVDAVQIFVQRDSSIGDSAAASLSFFYHNLAKTDLGTGGNPTFSGATAVGDVMWGESKWILLPVTFAEQIRDGTAKGVAVYNNDNLALLGVSELALSGELKVTYH